MLHSGWFRAFSFALFCFYSTYHLLLPDYSESLELLEPLDAERLCEVLGMPVFCAKEAGPGVGKSGLELIPRAAAWAK